MRVWYLYHESASVKNRILKIICHISHSQVSQAQAPGRNVTLVSDFLSPGCKADPLLYNWKPNLAVTRVTRVAD